MATRSPVPAGRDQRRLVDQVRQVRSGEPGRERGHLLELQLGGKQYLLGVDAEDPRAAEPIGSVH